jgi:uridine kinase
MHEAQPVVIAIAGPSGSGKTTLVRQVAALLDYATQVYFDDYEGVSSYPVDMGAWLAGGASPDDWKTPQLAGDLAVLRMGQSVLHPDGATTIHPTPFLVIEEPFGRERHEMAPLIDFVAVIDVPLEVALARRIRRTFRHRSEQHSVEQMVEQLDSYLEFYIELGSALYGSVNARALATCDLAVDGRAPSEQLAEQIVAAVRERFGH